jgi:hypothetical protein
MRKQIDEKKEFEEAAKRLYTATNNFKALEKRFKEVKRDCENKIENYLQSIGSNSEVVEGRNYSTEHNLIVTRSQKTSVIFDASKLEKSLGKDLVSKVVIKKYEIVDIFGLVNYLKSCNVSPKIFMDFVRVEKQVDDNELNQLMELGEIEEKQVEGCYSVKKGNPYYKVKSVDF